LGVEKIGATIFPSPNTTTNPFIRSNLELEYLGDTVPERSEW
jgi:hypothetical protein